MKYSGVMGESKFKVLSSIPQKYTPKTIFISSSISYSSIQKSIKDNGILYPFIIKPDVGERGKNIEKINNEEELRSYLRGKCLDLNIQEFIDMDLEFGVLYHRHPGLNSGKITSIVQKGFLFLAGDGKSTIRQLLMQNIRSSNRIHYFSQRLKGQIDLVLENEKKILIEPIGNHCRGTVFYNANHLINDKLNSIFNEIATKIEGFYYGRFDLKVPSLDDLYAGNNIRIIELNGVSSEIAHIYDPDYKLLQAYKDVFKHMSFIYEIAKKNHENGVAYDSLWKFLKDLREHLKQ